MVGAPIYFLSPKAALGSDHTWGKGAHDKGTKMVEKVAKEKELLDWHRTEDPRPRGRLTLKTTHKQLTSRR